MTSIDLLLPALVSGMLFGGVYGLMALGLNLVYGVMRIINIMHGEMIMLGAYTSFWLQRVFGLDAFLSLPLVFVVYYYIGGLIFRFLIRPLYEDPKLSRDESAGLIVVLTLGLSLVMASLALYFWSGDVRVISTPLAGLSYNVGSISISFEKLASFLIAVGLALFVFIFTRKADVGRGIIATIQEPEAAQLVGVNVRRVNHTTFCLSMALTAVSGPLIALFYPLTPSLGMTLLARSFAIVILGGFGNPYATIFSGIILALVEGGFSAFFPVSYTITVSFMFIIAILLLKPTGLFGVISK